MFPSPSIIPLSNKSVRILESFSLESSSISFSSSWSFSSCISFWSSVTNSDSSFCFLSLAFCSRCLSLSKAFLNSLCDFPLLTIEFDEPFYPPDTICEDERRSAILLSMSIDKFLLLMMCFFLSLSTLFTKFMNDLVSRVFASKDNDWQILT